MAIFYVTYILFVAMVLLNVVIAVLLGKFGQASADVSVYFFFFFLFILLLFVAMVLLNVVIAVLLSKCGKASAAVSVFSFFFFSFFSFFVSFQYRWITLGCRVGIFFLCSFSFFSLAFSLLCEIAVLLGKFGRLQ